MYNIDIYQALARNYSESLSIPLESCTYALRELQEHALEKLKERDHFKSTGIATLKIRIPKEGLGTRIINVEVRLGVMGLELKNDIASRIDTSPDRYLLTVVGVVNHIFYYILLPPLDLKWSLAEELSSMTKL